MQNSSIILDINKSEVGSDVSSDVGSDVSSDVGSDVDYDVGSDVDYDVGSDVDYDVGSDIKTENLLSQYNIKQCSLSLHDKSKLYESKLQVNSTPKVIEIDKLVESFINNNLELDKYYYLKFSNNCIFNKYYNECYIY